MSSASSASCRNFARRCSSRPPCRRRSVALHGDMAQAKRTETLERFKNGDAHLMVASDVAARGLDVQGLSHVFNFDVPIHAEDYVHRIGRTGRAGLHGKSFTIAAP